MFTLDGIRKFHHWTHSTLGLVLDHLATIPAGDYTKEVPGFGFPTLRHQVLHILNCEGFWVHNLQGLSYGDRAISECPSISDARAFEQEICEQTLAYLSRLSDQQLNADTELRFSDGDHAVRTPALVLRWPGATLGATTKARRCASPRTLPPRPDSYLGRLRSFRRGHLHRLGASSDLGKCCKVSAGYGARFFGHLPCNQGLVSTSP